MEMIQFWSFSTELFSLSSEPEVLSLVADQEKGRPTLSTLNAQSWEHQGNETLRDELRDIQS